MGIRSIAASVLRSLLAALAVAILLSPSSAGVVMARPAFNLVTVDDHPPQTGLSYPGSGWVHWTGMTNAINNTVSSSGVAGDSVSYTFTGSTITWLYSMAANRGTQTISIDGVVKDAAFNSYAPQTRRQIGKTWAVNNGTHTITVKNNTNGLGFVKI